MGRIKSPQTAISAAGTLQASQAAPFIASHCRMKSATLSGTFYRGRKECTPPS